MVKAKLEKGQKPAKTLVEAPKDRIKSVKKLIKAEKKEKPEKKPTPLVKKEVNNEAPEEVPIGKKDEWTTVTSRKTKNKKKKQEKKSTLNKVQKGKVEKPELSKKKKKKVTQQAKRFQRIAKIVAEEEIVEADPPKILATTDAVRTAVIALRKAAEDESKEKKELFDKEFRYCLQVCCIKIPRVPKREVRLVLPHTLYDDTDDVCLIVRDEVRGSKQDPEVTALHYEKIFKQQKIDFIKKVMPMSELKQNYGPFEMKRKLEKTYDVFLADNIISGHVFKLFGKHFIETRKTAIPVKIKNIEPANLKDELLKGLSKTVYKQTNQGMTTAIPVATHKHSVEQFVTNVEKVLEYLKTHYPGGWLNIKNIYMKPMKHSKISLPLYISEISPNQVRTPNLVGPKQQRLMKLAKQVEQESEKFKVTEDFQLEKKGIVKVEPKIKNEKKQAKGKKRANQEVKEEDQEPDSEEKPAPAKKQKTKEKKLVKVKAEPKKPVHDESNGSEDSEEQSDEETNLIMSKGSDDDDIDLKAAGFVAESDDDDDGSDDDVEAERGGESDEDSSDDDDDEEEEEQPVVQPTKKQKTEKVKAPQPQAVKEKFNKQNQGQQQKQQNRLNQNNKPQNQNQKKFQPKQQQDRQQNGQSPQKFGNKFGNKNKKPFQRQVNGGPGANRKPFQGQQNGKPGQNKKPFQKKGQFGGQKNQNKFNKFNKKQKAD